MPERPYTGRRYRFGDDPDTAIYGTVASEPFSIVLGQANGNDILAGEMTHGCIAVSLDVEHRHTRLDEHTGTAIYIGTIIGHVDDVLPQRS